MDDSFLALGRLARTHPNLVAFSEIGGSSVSYSRLFHAVCALARDFRPLPDVVGLAAPGGIAWVAANLALMATGRTVVPLPEFFSQEQLANIVEDAAVGHILATQATRGTVAGANLPVSEITLPGRNFMPRPVPDANAGGSLIIYTSGSTGRPKGVRIGSTQLAHSARALGTATGAAMGDVYLSVLPISLLLEQVCAIHVPLHAGVPVIFGGRAAETDLMGLARRVQPTLMVLVPSLLSAWRAELEHSGTMAPCSLRFVAVGGAHVPEGLAEAAWRVGIPVHEGYGLSECCSVVALARPGECKTGTVGRPLDGIKVTIENDEIVVRGPTVMDGYLNHETIPRAGVWRTGDLGAFDAEGRLIVLGRKDSMLVTAAGRNVVPEWIESMVNADPRVAHCVLIDSGSGGLTAVLVPYDHFAGVFQAMSDRDRAQYLAELLAAAPGYAKPARSVVVAQSDFRRQGLLTTNDRPRRRAVEAVYARAEGSRLPAPRPEFELAAETPSITIPHDLSASP